MKVNTFANYLLVALIGLQICGYLLLFFSWIKFGTEGLAGAIIISLLADILILKYLKSLKVYDDNGMKQDLTQILGDIIAVVIILIASTFILTFITIVIGYNLAEKHDRSRITGVMIPFLASGILYGSLFLC